MSGYRPDIDGLRAVAVLLVVFYHAGLILHGGFVGVDVFFVISGYVITQSIIRSQRDPQFGLKTFWARRVRRLLPAAYLMILLVNFAGFFLLWPDDYRSLNLSALSTISFAANLYFWQNTGYFDGSSDLMPLLHMWSLAVEEQFYVIYPTALLVSLKLFSQKTNLIIFSLIAFSSLLGCVYASYAHPSANYYLLPTRAWEMLLGCLLSVSGASLGKKKRMASPLGIAGLAMVVVGGFYYTHETRFPGLTALLPCIGATAIIYAGCSESGLAYKVLARRPMVYLGRMSYSIYLWHWPFLAYARYEYGAEPSHAVKLICLAMGFVVAFLSWRFIENPIRRASSISSLTITLATSISVVVIASFSALTIYTDGARFRYKEQALAFKDAEQSCSFLALCTTDDVITSQLPRFGSTAHAATCVVWGDSHSMALMPGIDKACNTLSITGVQAAYPSTPPILDFMCLSRAGLNEKAPEFNRAVVDYAIREEVDFVIMAGVWHVYQKKEGFEHKLRRTIAELTESDVKVLIVLDVPRHDGHTPLMLARAVNNGIDPSKVSVSRSQHQALNEEAEKTIRLVASDYGHAWVIDPAPSFASDADVYRAAYQGASLYRDAHHLSTEGGEYLADFFTEHFKVVLGIE